MACAALLKRIEALRASVDDLLRERYLMEWPDGNSETVSYTHLRAHET